MSKKRAGNPTPASRIALGSSFGGIKQGFKHECKTHSSKSDITVLFRFQRALKVARKMRQKEGQKRQIPVLFGILKKCRKNDTRSEPRSALKPDTRGV